MLAGLIVGTLLLCLGFAYAFVSAVETTKDGAKTDRWGPNAKGLFILEANGRYSFMISRADIPKFAVNSVTEGTAEENKTVVRGIIASVGMWSVDETSKTLIMIAEAGSFPKLNGSAQKRIIRSLTADEKKYTNPASSTGAVAEAAWKRAK